MDSIQNHIKAHYTDYALASVLGYIIWETTAYIFLDANYGTTQKSAFKQTMNDFLWGCACETDNPVLHSLGDMTKGSKYFFIRGKEYNDIYRKKCLITNYHIAHFLMYMVFGFLFPNIIPELIVVSSLFEVFEYYYCNCEDIMDIVYNVVGLYVGKYIREKMCQ
jgi:hypothetical protein